MFSINRDYNALELKESFEHEIGKANYLRGVGFISEEVAKSRFYTLYCYYKFMQNEDFMYRYREFLDKQKDYKKKKMLIYSDYDRMNPITKVHAIGEFEKYLR